MKKSLALLAFVVLFAACATESTPDIRVPPTGAVAPTPTPTVTVDIEIPGQTPTIEGRWRGIVVCDWDKEKWGGGEYKFGNGKLSGKVDFTVSNGTIKVGNRDYPGHGRFWMDWSGGGHKIQSFEVSKQKITIETKALENISNWEATLVTNNTIDLIDDLDSYKGELYRTEEISFDSYSPKKNS
jgi:hypothetical protein